MLMLQVQATDGLSAGKRMQISKGTADLEELLQQFNFGNRPSQSGSSVLGRVHHVMRVKDHCKEDSRSSRSFCVSDMSSCYTLYTVHSWTTALKQRCAASCKC